MKKGSCHSLASSCSPQGIKQHGKNGEYSRAHLTAVQITSTVEFEKNYEQEHEGDTGRTVMCHASVQI